jgi:hypothetical protein
MKKIFALLFIVSMTLFVAGCDNNGDVTDPTTTTDTGNGGTNGDGTNQEKQLSDYYTISSQEDVEATEDEPSTRYVYVVINDLAITEEKMTEVVEDVVDQVKQSEDFAADKVTVLLNDSAAIAKDYYHTLGLAVFTRDKDQPTQTGFDKFVLNSNFYEKEAAQAPSSRDYDIYNAVAAAKAEFNDSYFTEAKYQEIARDMMLLNDVEVEMQEIAEVVANVSTWIDGKDISDEMLYE